MVYRTLEDGYLASKKSSTPRLEGGERSLDLGEMDGFFRHTYGMAPYPKIKRAAE
jgi:hypothetical protein